MQIFQLAVGNTKLSLHQQTRALFIEQDGVEWHFQPDSRILYADGTTVQFSEYQQIVDSEWKTGVGRGIKSVYTGKDCSFETIVWVEEATGNLYFEWIPLAQEKKSIDRIFYPGTVAFEKDTADWYSLINYEQGILLPNNWKTALQKLPFDGRLCSCAAYMPWFAQVKERAGYLAINETPWDAGYRCDHPENGGYTALSYYWLPTLGKMDYRRVLRYTFFADCDYNTICKAYRAYIRETGHFTSLQEKIARNPKVEKFIGAGFVHCGIKTHVAENSEFFDPQAPDKNNSLTPFAQRTAEVKAYHDAGVEKLYLHLDGWGDPGYDNQHPDYLPACKEAGGFAGMKELSDTMQQCGYLFGVHDQYRDYYHAAKSYDENFGIRDPEGKVFEMARWAGGPQGYLCATQVEYYLRRNFGTLQAQGIHLDGAYLDVFTCNEPDECSHPEHRMSRKECLDYRRKAFDYLTAHGIVPSSEEVTDWAADSLVFCHYAPYDFMLAAPDAPRKGIPVPLFNLVYHDAMIIPWPMDQHPEREDDMLYALLNGGTCYITRNAAYPGIDGAFDGGDLPLEKRIERYRVVAALHEKVATKEMVSHQLLSKDGTKQRSIFADGTTVTVDFAANQYTIA